MDKTEKYEAVIGDHLMVVTAGDGSVRLTLGMIVLDETSPYEERIDVRLVLALGAEEAYGLATAVAEAAAASEGVVE